jgi:hypothetical protein
MAAAAKRRRPRLEMNPPSTDPPSATPVARPNLPGSVAAALNGTCFRASWLPHVIFVCCQVSSLSYASAGLYLPQHQSQFVLYSHPLCITGCSPAHDRRSERVALHLKLALLTTRSILLHLFPSPAILNHPKTFSGLILTCVLSDSADSTQAMFTGYNNKKRVNERYKIVGFISSGTYGRVYKAEGKNGRVGEFAIKKYAGL